MKGKKKDCSCLLTFICVRFTWPDRDGYCLFFGNIPIKNQTAEQIFCYQNSMQVFLSIIIVVIIIIIINNNIQYYECCVTTWKSTLECFSVPAGLMDRLMIRLQ